MFVPQGLRYAVRLTVTNPSASTMGGSTSTPSVSPTDYVASLHLPGDNAFAVQILTNATDTTTFKDVSVWFGATQLDIDYDTVTYGAWNSTNGITLSFKLQAPIAAGAIDTNYLLAWGSVNTSPTAPRNLDNIYPFQDSFAGTSLSSKWTANPDAVVNDGLTLSTTSGFSYIKSATATFGSNYLLSLFGTLPQPIMPGSSKANGLASRDLGLLATEFAELYSSNGTVTVAQKKPGGTALTNTVTTADDNPHLFAVWRDSGNLAHGARGLTAMADTSGQEFNDALPVQLFAWNGAGDGRTIRLTAQYVKVRAWVGVNAIVSVGYAYVPVGYQYAQRLSVTNPSTTLAMPGSTNAATLTGTDVVAQLHLAPDDALDILNLSSFKASDFRDVTLWYGATQLDIDYDTITNGPWNSSNGLTLCFKLQAPIPAGGTDSNYLLAWGNSSPTVLRTLDNIYPFQDSFAGTTLDTSKWTAGPGVTVSNGLTLSATSGYAYIESNKTPKDYEFVPGYLLSLYGTLTLTGTASAQKASGLSFRSGTGTTKHADVYSSSQVGVSEYNTALATATIATMADSGPHVFSVWRDPATGLAQGWRDSSTNAVLTQGFTDKEPVQLYAYNTSGSGSAQLTAQYVKVRPFIGVEATVALASVMTALGYPRIANVLGLDDSGGQAATMARYALIIADQKLWVPAVGQPIIDAVRKARVAAYRELALVIYQSSAEANYNTSSGAVAPNQPAIIDAWWLFYALNSDPTMRPTLAQALNASTPGATDTVYLTNASALYTNLGAHPLLRIDSESMVITSGIGTATLTVVRGALGTDTSSGHGVDTVVRQHVCTSSSVFNAAVFNLTSATTNGNGQTPPQYLASLILGRLAALWGVDGVFLDNVMPLPTFLPNYTNIDLGTGVAATQPALELAWGTAQQALQSTLRQGLHNIPGQADVPGIPALTIIGNGAVYPASDGREIEQYPYLDPYIATGQGGVYPAFRAAAILPAYFQMALHAANAATIVNPDSTQNVDKTAGISLQQMRDDLGEALLANGGYAYDGGGTDHGTPWWFDEYDQGAETSLTVLAPQSMPTHITVALGTAAGLFHGASPTTPIPIYLVDDGGPGLNDDEALAVIGYTPGAPGATGDDVTLAAAVTRAHQIWQKVLRVATYPATVGWLGQPLEAPVGLTPLPAPTTANNLTLDWEFNSYNTATQQFTYWPLTQLGHSTGSVAQVAGRNGGSDTCAKITITAVDNQPNAFNLYIGQSNLMLAANTTYTLTFWAKTSSPYGFPLVMVLAVGLTILIRETYTLGATWQQYTLTYTTGASGSTVQLQVLLGTVTSAATGDVYLDTVTLQQGNPNVAKREFENGMVIVNGTSQAYTYALPSAGTGRYWSHINGTQDHSHNSGPDSPPPNNITSVTVQPMDSVILIRV